MLISSQQTKFFFASHSLFCHRLRRLSYAGGALAVSGLNSYSRSLNDGTNVFSDPVMQDFDTYFCAGLQDPELATVTPTAVMSHWQKYRQNNCFGFCLSAYLFPQDSFESSELQTLCCSEELKTPTALCAPKQFCLPPDDSRGACVAQQFCLRFKEIANARSR